MLIRDEGDGGINVGVEIETSVKSNPQYARCPFQCQQEAVQSDVRGRLFCLRGKRMMVDLWADMVNPCSSAQTPTLDDWAVRISAVWGTPFQPSCEVVWIPVDKLIALGSKGRWYSRSMKDPYSVVAGGGESKVVSTGDCPPFDVIA